MLQNRKPRSGKQEGMANVKGTDVRRGATFINQRHIKLKQILHFIYQNKDTPLSCYYPLLLMLWENFAYTSQQDCQFNTTFMEDDLLKSKP